MSSRAGASLSFALFMLCAPGVARSEVPLKVGVAPLRGDAPAEVRARAARVLLDALGGLPDISIVSLTKLGEMFGPEAGAAIAACTDDPCVVREAARVRLDVIVSGELDLRARQSIRLRLLGTSTATAEPTVRVSREARDDEGALREVITAAVLELFPERAAKSFGTLVLVGAPAGARVIVDGRSAGIVPQDVVGRSVVPLQLGPGEHAVEVLAPGHRAFEQTTRVWVGQRTDVTVELQKNRSRGPLILGGLGAAGIAVAGVVGLLAADTASSWRDACPNAMPCAPGFTQARYLSDASSVDRGRVVSNGLLVVGSAAIVGAVIWFFVDPGEDPEGYVQ